LYLSSLKSVWSHVENHTIFWFYDDLCDLSDEGHIDLASVVICDNLCDLIFQNIFVIWLFRKSMWVMPQKHTDLWAIKSCDSWPQITHVKGALRSHGWWVDRPKKKRIRCWPGSNRTGFFPYFLGIILLRRGWVCTPRFIFSHSQNSSTLKMFIRLSLRK
jgi:hypothetical protein